MQDLMFRRRQDCMFLEDTDDRNLNALRCSFVSWVARGWKTRRPRFEHRQKRKDFSSILCVQTGSGADPTSCTMGIGGPFGAKARPVRDADHSPHLVPRSRMSRSYTSSPPGAFMACSGTILAFFSSSFRERDQVFVKQWVTLLYTVF
jgi:hypothetical protein